MPIPFARPIALTLSLAAASPALALECFSMFDANNALVYQSSTSPIDLSRSISSQMARRFPQRVLVISDLGACQASGAAEVGTSASAAALLPARNGDGPGAFGAGATSPAPVAPVAVDTTPARSFARAPGGRR